MLRDLAAADPRKPFRNAATAEEVRLEVDFSALLRKRLVVNNGAITGLQFGSERETSGALAPSLPADSDGSSLLDPLMAATSSAGAAWFDQLASKLKVDVREQLQTPRAVKQVKKRWPEQYAALEAQVKALTERGTQMRSEYNQLARNPLGNIKNIESLQREMVAVNQELLSLSENINRLPGQIEADRKFIEAAAAADQQWIRKQLAIEEINAAELSNYLLDAEASGYLKQAIAWIEQARRLAPSDAPAAKSSRLPGVNVLFVDRAPPRWLIERLALSGSARLGGAPLQLSGTLTDASSDQSLHGIPLRLSLGSEGAVECDVQVVIDRTGETDRDALRLVCSRLPMKGRTVGGRRAVAITMSPGEAALRADIALENKELAGSITLVQKGLALRTESKSGANAKAFDTINKALAAVDGFTATVALSGTIEKPSWKLDSDLGPQIATTLQSTAEELIRQPAERALAESRSQIESELANLEAQRLAAQEKLLDRLGAQHQALAQLVLAKPRDMGARKTVPQIGQLPWGKFRR